MSSEEQIENSDTTERITISTSNIFNDQLKELARHYMESKTLTLRLILREFVTSPQLIEDFDHFYHHIYKFIKKDGVSTSSIQKTFYANKKVLDKFKKLVNRVGKNIPKESMVSEFTRALISFFHKRKITDHREKVKTIISHLDKVCDYKVKEYSLSTSGLVVTFSLKKK